MLSIHKKSIKKDNDNKTKEVTMKIIKQLISYDFKKIPTQKLIIKIKDNENRLLRFILKLVIFLTSV